MKRLSIVLLTGIYFSFLYTNAIAAQAPKAATPAQTATPAKAANPVPAKKTAPAKAVKPAPATKTAPAKAAKPAAPAKVTPANASKPAVQPAVKEAGKADKNTDKAEEPTADEKKKAESEKKKKAESEKKKNTQRKAQHLEKIGKLKFDRRPSAILKAWCGLAAEEEAEAEKKRKQKEAADKKVGKTTGSQPAAPDPSDPFSSQPATTFVPPTPPASSVVYAPLAAPAMAARATAVPAVPAGSISPQQKAALIKAAQSGAAQAMAASTGGAATKPGENEKPDPFDEEIKTFSKNVTLGKWREVKEYIGRIDKDEAKALYKRLLSELQGSGGNPPSVPPAMIMHSGGMSPAILSSMARGKGEQHVVTLDDFFALADTAPFDLDKDNTLVLLGGLVSRAIEQGHVIEGLIQRLKLDVEKPDKKAVFSRRQAAKLLCNSGHTIHTGEFLPEIEIAKTNKDHEALNLLSRYQLAVYAKHKKIVNLEKAWQVTQAILADKKKIDLKQKQEALARAVELSPKIRKEVGRKWLEESFTKHPQRGMEIVATIGSAASSSFQQQRHNPDQRLRSLKLQTTAVEALIATSPKKAGHWRVALKILATNWLTEAAISHRLDASSSYGPIMQRDPFGNIFYIDMEERNRRYSRNSNEPRPIKSSELLDIKPSDAWVELLPDLEPRLAMLYAQLLLKVNEEDAAFPYIEKLAKSHPGQAENLAEEFLRVWTRNHDPNASRNRTRSYMFMYGFERKAEGIPLTRSKQERNLVELSGWVKRINALPLEKLDDKLLASAFTNCHSKAEIYRLDAMEKIFGSIDNLKPKTLAELMRQMRVNLVGQWRKPDLQKKSNTNRKQKDIQAEVLRGYQLAGDVVKKALQKHPHDWRLTMAKAALAHDENNYRSQLAKDPKFSQRREKALAELAKAARLYAAEVPELDKDEISSEAFDIWFYASLGECDLGRIAEDTSADLKQPKLIRRAILDLPGEAAEKHMGMFANNIFTRMSAVKPAVKFRYLRGAFEIVGDHKQAHEARKVYDYYKDLVTEIKLDARTDGSDTVTTLEPFGVFVNIRHTREIERESGGFGRYLQNQNRGNSYYYNYGRPKANYRERFEEVVQQALEEHFEILSVTFQSEKVHSRADKEYGWRTTPYAYILLKPRGNQIDKIQPLRLDFDFLDTSGYVVLPVESPALPIDVADKKAPPRPVENLEITQILDERQADEGKLILEIKATGHGLIPPLEEIMDIRPKDFEVVDTEDQGLAVSKFAEDAEKNCVVSERSWLVTFGAKGDLSQRPGEFAFAVPKLETAKSLRQRYDDADLVPAEDVVSLERDYGEPSHSAHLAIGAGILAVVVLIIFAWAAIRSVVRNRKPLESFMPKDISPFSVLALLRSAQQNPGLSDTRREELSQTINRIERYYFVEAANGKDNGTDANSAGNGRNGEPDLKQVARTWSKTLRQKSQVEQTG